MFRESTVSNRLAEFLSPCVTCSSEPLSTAVTFPFTLNHSSMVFSPYLSILSTINYKSCAMDNAIPQLRDRRLHNQAGSHVDGECFLAVFNFEGMKGLTLTAVHTQTDP